MTVALAVVQQAVELVGPTGDGGGFQPAFVRGAVAGLQAGTDVLAWLDDVVRVQGVVADGTTDGVLLRCTKLGEFNHANAIERVRPHPHRRRIRR